MLSKVCKNILLLLLLLLTIFTFVDIIQHLKMLQIVLRLKKLIKASYKTSKIKILKDTFQQSFKLHNYCEEKKTRAQMHTYSHVHITSHAYTHMQAYTHATYRHNYIHANVPIYT